MAYETDRDSPALGHHVLLEDREQLVISGVEEVESFDGGDLKVEGRVNALIYETEGGRRGGLLARLLGGG